MSGDGSTPDLATWLEGWCDHELGPIHGADCCAWREAAQAVRLLESDADARNEKALRHDLAATFDSHLNRDQTYTGAQVAAILRDGGQ